MLRISAIEDHNEQRLVLEGKLIVPWTSEVRSACEKARQTLEGRELVVDLKNLTVISVGIPMMSISHSDLMPISSERSDAEPS